MQTIFASIDHWTREYLQSRRISLARLKDASNPSPRVRRQMERLRLDIAAAERQRKACGLDPDEKHGEVR